MRLPVSRKGSRELDGDERGRGCLGAREGGGRTRRTSSGLVWSMVGSGWPGSGARGRECVEPRTVSRSRRRLDLALPLCRSSRSRSAANYRPCTELHTVQLPTSSLLDRDHHPAQPQQSPLALLVLLPLPLHLQFQLVLRPASSTRTTATWSSTSPRASHSRDSTAHRPASTGTSSFKVRSPLASPPTALSLPRSLPLAPTALKTRPQSPELYTVHRLDKVRRSLSRSPRNRLPLTSSPHSRRAPPAPSSSQSRVQPQRPSAASSPSTTSPAPTSPSSTAASATASRASSTTRSASTTTRSAYAPRARAFTPSLAGSASPHRCVPSPSPSVAR